MYKNESIDDTLKRIAIQELGLKISTTNKKFLGQFSAKFKTEHNRQDLSTGYLIKIVADQTIVLNSTHFSTSKIISAAAQIPSNTGAMYRFYLETYFNFG